MKTHEDTTDAARIPVAPIPSDLTRLRPLPPNRNRRRF